MKNVLWFVDRLLIGGIQSFLKNVADNIEKDDLQIDFLVLDDGNHYELEDYFVSKGHNVYKLNKVWVKNTLDFIKYCKALNEFFKLHNDYDVVHMHSSSKNFPVLYYAKKYGVKKRIAHSHNIDFQTGSQLKKIVGKIFKIPLIHYANYYFACSETAGKWLFGEKITESDNFYIIRNGIDVDKFKYSDYRRKELRLKYGITNEIVIGHVGRFTNQKNHSFLIDIFNEMCKKNNNLLLLLIGSGEDENIIKEKVDLLGLSSKVIFAGFQRNVSKFMQAMDIFLFPSLFEGLGIVLIEAQAAGLPCFTSEDVVPEEAMVSSHLKYIPLQKSAKEWAEIILNSKIERYVGTSKIINNMYDIKIVSQQIHNLYCE